MSARKRTLRERMRILFHNLRYCTTRLFSYDHEEACRSMLKMGKQLANPIPPYWNKCPVCEHELERTVRADGVIVAFCPRWHFHPTQASFPDIERVTDKRPVQAFLQARQNGAGIHTAMERAIPKPTIPLKDVDGTFPPPLGKG